MLYYIHMPPPLSVVTFRDYFNLLWTQTIGKYVLQKSAGHVYLVFDNPDFLPPPRSIVHKSRGKRAQTTSLDPTIEDTAAIPHNQTYSSLLANSSTFKSHLLRYITAHFRDKAAVVTTSYNFTLTIDSPTFVVRINNGVTACKVNNEHGEADYAIWHHAILEPSQNIMVVSSDTDTWVYGLGLYELRHLGEKEITVQRGNTECYIDIKKATSLLAQHPKLSALSFPVLSLVALYVLTGCDYVSSFYRNTKTTFLVALIEYADFICPDGHFLNMINNEFQHIRESSWIKLVTAVYYSKFKKFFRSKSVGYTYDLLTNHLDSPEIQRMLSSLHYTPCSMQLPAWHEFIRRVTYHVPKVTKFHEHKLVPSYQALLLHCKRANYVLKLALSAPWTHSPFLPCFEQFGWHVDNDTIFITWDSDLHESDEESDSDSELSDCSNTSDSADSC